MKRFIFIIFSFSFLVSVSLFAATLVSINSLSFSPDGNLLASGSSDGTLLFGDVEVAKKGQSVNPGSGKLASTWGKIKS